MFKYISCAFKKIEPDFLWQKKNTHLKHIQYCECTINKSLMFLGLKHKKIKQGDSFRRKIKIISCLFKKSAQHLLLYRNSEFSYYCAWKKLFDVARHIDFTVSNKSFCSYEFPTPSTHFPLSDEDTVFVVKVVCVHE